MFMEGANMPFRGGSGVARYGLPGLVLGLAIASAGDGGRGPAARAQPPPATERPRMMHAGGRGVGDAGLHLAAGGTAQLLYLDRHQDARVRHLPGRSRESQGDREAGGGPAVRVRPEAGPVQQPTPRGHRDRVDGEDPGAAESIGRGRGRARRRGPFPHRLTPQTERPRRGRSDRRGARPWLNFTASKRPPASWA